MGLRWRCGFSFLRLWSRCRSGHESGRLAAERLDTRCWRSIGERANQLTTRPRSRFLTLSDPPAGAPPFKGRIAAERELMESLWHASETFREEGDGGLEGCKIACRAVARFIAVRHQNPELAAPLLALHAALQDVERGV